MSNLFTRLKNTIAADFHEVLDQKEQKNPISLLNQYLRQCEQEVEKVRKLVERQYQLKEEFSREYKEAKALADKRKYQSEIALQAGESALYEFASQEQAAYEGRAAKLSQSLQQASEQLVELEQKYENMKHKLKDMQIRRMDFMGRENMSRAHYRINKVLDTEKYSNESSARFEEMEEYLERLEHQVNSAYYRNTIDAKIVQLEKEMKNKENNSNS